MNYKAPASFVLSALVSTIAASPRPASATFQRQLPASACYTFTSSVSLGSTGLYNNNGTTDAAIFCPVLSDQSLLKENISNLNVDVDIGSSVESALAQACVTFQAGPSGGMAGACGTATSASGVGHHTLAPSRSVFTAAHTWDYGYVFVSLPNTGSGTQVQSNLDGIDMS